MSIQYMTPSGDWAISCQEGTPPPSAALILAPADADGFYGCEGMRWDGKAWVADPGAFERAFAVMYPDAALAQERADMACSRTQAKKALGKDLWLAIQAYVDYADNWDLEADFEAQTWHRTNENLCNMAKGPPFNMTDEQIDNLFRLAMTL